MPGNLLTRSLRTPHVALLVETSLASGRDILRGIARYVRERGPWSLFHSPRSLEQSAPAWLRGWRGDGIIARITDPEVAQLIKETGRPAVDVLGMVPDTGFPLVHVDDAAIARLAFDHFVERGFRRFAFLGIVGEEWMRRGRNWSQRRQDAFFECARAAGAEPALFEFAPHALDAEPWERRQDQLTAWLRRLPKPLGLMVCSDQRGPDALDACRRANIAVPDEVAVIGVDNDEPLCEVCDPPLSSVLPDHFDVGYQAAACLDRLMNGAAACAEPQLVAPGRVVSRQSSDGLAVDDRAVTAALRLIRERACLAISVDEIARDAGTSRSVLQRRFRAALGRTIHDQIIATRLKRAEELISSTDLPLPEIAETCGFNHQEYMGVVFRERLGKTPAQVRKAAEAARLARPR
jgi:LacI family transcriptional regulator